MLCASAGARRELMATPETDFDQTPLVIRATSGAPEVGPKTPEVR